MPVLDIIDNRGELRQLAPITVAATMLSPTDEQFRDQIFAVGYTNTAIAAAQSIPWEIARVTNDGPGTEGVNKRVEREGYSGWVAGQILLLVLRLAVHHPQHATVRKAIYICEKELVRGRTASGKR